MPGNNFTYLGTSPELLKIRGVVTCFNQNEL
jgi:hypothetical protein